MQIHVEYTAQLKRAAGTGEEDIELPDNAVLTDLFQAIRQRHPGQLDEVLFAADGRLEPSVIVFVGQKQTRCGKEPIALTDQETVTLLCPISGG